ncbi:MAG: adenosylmethionine--8-amino-7-oxononanoate transaminase [Chitinophagaceae bacterium]
MSNLVAQDKALIWHPFTAQKNMPNPIAITHGKGTLLFDEDGHQYIDAISSWWVTLHGHAHPAIAECLYQQAMRIEQVIFAGFTHEPAVQLAAALLPALPGSMARIFYSDNGSTSTEVAIKMSIQYWWNKGMPERKKIVAFEGAYHGDTFGAMSVSDRSVFTIAFKDLLFDIITLPLPTPANIGDCKAILHQHASSIAAFIYEPLVQGAGGMNMYEAHLLNELLNTAKLLDIICIADEVMTGFGRTGMFFASEYMHKKPDIICLSKGITGGTMALGVTAVTQKIYDAFVSSNALKTFFHGHSFTANPLACAVAYTSWQLLQQPSTIEKIAWICERNRAAVDHLRKYLTVNNIRQLGTIVAFEVSTGEKGYLNNISAWITQYCMQRGVYIRPLGNTVYWMPPYCITPHEYNTMLSVITNMLTNLPKEQ